MSENCATRAKKILSRIRAFSSSSGSIRKRIKSIANAFTNRDYYEPCEDCRDIGYKGRVAIFDVLEITDDMRQIIAADVDLDKKNKALRQAAFKSGQRGYLVDGARLVKNGVTSYEELIRVLSGKR